MIVGEASVVIVPETAGFAAALDAETQGVFGNFKKDAEVAGEDAGAGLRGGVKDGAGKLENDLSDIGAVGGANLRSGVTKETGKLGDDLEKDGTKAGAGLEKGASSGLSKLAGLISNTSLPLGGLSSGLERSAGAAEHAEKSTGGFAESLGGAAGPLAAVGVAAVVGAGYAVHLAEGMESADAAIAGAAGTSVGAAKKIGDSFNHMQNEFTGQETAKAFAEVAGQLKSVEGHALSTAEADKFMAASMDLATAKQIELGEATKATAGILQTFRLSTSEAAHVTDVLYSTSNATGVGVGALATQLEKIHSKLGDSAGSVGQLSSLLVDMKNQGISGRAAMSGLNTAMNTLQATAGGVGKALSAQSTAYDALTPSLKGLAKQYQDGSISSSAFKKETEGLPPAQEAAVAAFTKASTAVQTAQLKYKEMGVNVFDAQGKFVGLGSIIDQLAPRFSKMSNEQKRTTAETLFGKGAAAQMTAVLDAGSTALDKATKETEKHGTAQAGAAKQSGTLHNELKTLDTTFIKLGTDLGETLIPIVTFFAGVLLKLVPVVETVVSFIKSHWAILPVILEAPIVIAIVAFETFKGKIESIFSSIVSWIKGAWHTVETDTSSVVNNVTSFFSRLPGKVEGFFSTIGHDIAGVWREVSGSASHLIGEVTGFFGELPGKIMGVVSKIPGEMLHLGEAIVEGIEHGMEKLGGSLLSKAKSIAEAPKKAIESVWGAIKSPAPVAVRMGEGISQGLAEGMKKGAPTAMAAAASVAQQIVDFWEKHGFSKAAGAGFAGNAAQESSDNPNEPGGGLYQQSGDGASGTGSVAEQSQQVLERLGSGLAAALKKITDPAEAANLIMKDFEKPEGSQPGETSPAAIANANAAHREAAAREAFGGGGSSGPAPAAQAATQKASLEKQVAQQKQALAEWVARTTASVADGTKAQKAAAAQEIAERKALVAREIADEKAGSTKEQAVQKEEEKKRTSDMKAGTSALNKMLEAIHSGSLKTLSNALEKVHLAGLAKIEKDLDSDHKAALTKLSAELVKVHKEALEKEAALEAKAKKEANEKAAAAAAELAAKAQEAAQKAAEEQAAAAQKAAEEQERATVAAIDKQTSITSDTASNAAQAIADSTKVTLDKQAEAGLSGTAEIAARLQTVLDEVTAESDSQIGAAKIAEDQAVGTGAIAEAEAASHLASVESAAKLREAEAQAKLELSKGVAGTTTASSAGPGINIESLVIHEPGASSAQIIGELGWSLRTGSLPVAQLQATVS